ncbi:MAG: OadG family protein [Clostridia bacterium]|nr:OadG family protein [Clostridia bacterium]
MNALLAVEFPTEYSEVMLLGFQVFLIGIATVFSVLILIWGILSLFKLFFGTKAPKENKPVISEVSSAVTVSSAQDEIVAAIAAAIAFAEEEAPGMKFRVVSFKKR